MRLYFIVSDLITKDDYLTVEYFAKKFEVSKRTIQNDLSYLNQISKQKGFVLQQFRGNGYLLKIQNKNQFSEFWMSLSNDDVSIGKNRVENIMAYIAIQQDYISMDAIADYFKISKTLVKREMEKVSKQFHKYGLTLERKKHYGVALQKMDIPYVKMLTELYQHENSILIKDLKETIGDFEVIYKTLVTEFAKSHLIINYAELKEVYEWLQVSTYYACLHPDQHFHKPSKDNSVSIIVNHLNRWIFDVYGVYLNQDLVNTLHKKIEQCTRPKVSTKKNIENLQKDIDDFLLETDDLNHTYFFQDKEFKKLLFNHVSMLIDRFYQKISYKNTLLNEISIRYPRVFNIAISFSNMLEEKYGVIVSHDETAFIATHFAAHFEREKQMKIHRFNRVAVVCSSGGGSAFMIKMQIKSLFSNEDVESFSFLEMDTLRMFNPDIIFTIMPLSEDFEVPIIYIHELLDDEDLLKIRQLMEHDQVNSVALGEFPSIVNTLFSKDFFEIGKSNSYEELLRRMALKIEKSGYGDNKYVENILERERYMSTVYMNGVAIPHPIEICAKRNVISTFIVQNDLNEKGKEVRVVFMISLTKQDYQRHQDITKLLYLLMKDEARLQRVIGSGSFEEMMVVLREMEGMIR